MNSETNEPTQDWRDEWRTSDWLRNWRSNLLTGVLVLLALTAGTAIMKRLPDPQAIRQEPYVHTVSRNASVNLRTGRVNVVGLRAAPEIQTALATARTPEGTFLVLDIEYTALNTPGTLTNLQLETQDGRVFGGSPPAGGDTCGEAQPGLTLHCQVVFEMDKTALEGAKLRVPADTWSQGDDVALIDLHIDAALAKDLADRKTPAALNPAPGQER